MSFLAGFLLGIVFIAICLVIAFFVNQKRLKKKFEVKDFTNKK